MYWLGRYLERSEQLARYIKVQYFSTLDAPMIQQKPVILRSILSMLSDRYLQGETFDHELDEQEVLVEVAFNRENEYSIISNIHAARENARTVRNVISTELWEAINRLYHFTNNYDVNYYKTRGLYDFTTQLLQHDSIIRYYVNASLLRNDVWVFTNLGVHLERTAQTLRILSNKLYDVSALSYSGVNTSVSMYQWTTTLKILEIFDMYKRLHKNVEQRKVIEFVLSNPMLGKSIAYTLDVISGLLSKLSYSGENDKSLKFNTNKLAAEFKYLQYDEIKDDLQNYFLRSLLKIYKLNNQLEQLYFEQKSL